MSRSKREIWLYCIQHSSDARQSREACYKKDEDHRVIWSFGSIPPLFYCATLLRSRCSQVTLGSFGRAGSVSKKLVKGQQTGDIFNSVVDKFSNPRTRPHSEEGILSRLGGIKNLLAAVCTPMTLSDGSAAVTRLCRKCSKLDEDEAMLVCGICQVAFYCSRECQLDDWKAHYKICKPLDERLQKASHYRDSTLKSFLEENYFAIMSEIVDLTNEGTLTQKDLILELDFRPDGSGSARAFRDPPVFKIGRATDYLNGSRPAEPDWFLKGTDMYGNNVKPVIRGLRDQHKRVLSEGSGMLTIARQPSKLISAVRLNLFCGSDNQSLFSDKAIRSFQRCRNLLHTFGEVDDFDDEFSGGMKTIILRHHRSSLQWLRDTISRLGEEDILDHNEDTHSTSEEE
ncbi:expressed unknown protein [Seminavis robusta]|uniref:MYND-type domain-containing protein n=1 Tax=Seminavis robusta TaxID=568900 RepID=A0A9N8E895_9STRA|nr:expressed unknown protein [Seminavis robusta]|eukprot:Sro763_g198830.1 n/a (399) ;mRNA; r:14834-16030